ncbi:MAG: hypothetical protein QME44_08405 [Thermodesulfobacteriota bacterium]|nr:hypothetical protein [Thermodesulfobacteriota bacterium]
MILHRHDLDLLPVLGEIMDYFRRFPVHRSQAARQQGHTRNDEGKHNVFLVHESTLL